jgi:ankyrin repeat protein
MSDVIDARDRAGRTQLHYAALENDTKLATRLLVAGADPNAADKAGLTPLHFAAQEGSIAVAELLLSRGAHVDPEDGYGNTPLHAATFNSRGDGRLITLLRRNGADPTHPNRSGQTPVRLARMIANFPVAQWFADVPGDPTGT